MSTPSDATSARTDHAARATRLLTLLWTFNFLLLAAAIAWLLLDPLAPRVITRFRTGPMNIAGVEMLDFPRWRAHAFQAAALAVFVGLAAVAIALFLGPPKHRRLRSWLALTTLVALWLGLFVSWREFAWAGARWRLNRQIDQFEPVAAALRDEWPEGDGEIPDLGYFTAYPRVEATTLLVIADDAPPGRAPIAAVEHSSVGALRFQLAGDESGAWLEWHPPGSEPASFQSGLETKYILDGASPLGDGWHLTRYH